MYIHSTADSEKGTVHFSSLLRVNSLPAGHTQSFSIHTLMLTMKKKVKLLYQCIHTYIIILCSE